MSASAEKYPRGKFSNDDEGELALRIAVKDRTVIVDLGKPVAWFGLSGDQAAELGMMLIRRAREAGVSKPITFEVPFK